MGGLDPNDELLCLTMAASWRRPSLPVLLDDSILDNEDPGPGPADRVSIWDHEGTRAGGGWLQGGAGVVKTSRTLALTGTSGTATRPFCQLPGPQSIHAV